MVTHQLQVERKTGKFAGHRPTIYHCATQSTKRSFPYSTQERRQGTDLPFFECDITMLALHHKLSGTSAHELN